MIKISLLLILITVLLTGCYATTGYPDYYYRAGYYNSLGVWVAPVYISHPRYVDRPGHYFYNGRWNYHSHINPAPIIKHPARFHGEPHHSIESHHR